MTVIFLILLIICAIGVHRAQHSAFFPWFVIGIFVFVICLCVSINYDIVTSDLPDWFKFWLLSN